MSWIKARSVEESLVFLETMSSVCKDLGGPVSLRLFEMVKKRDFRGLVDFKVDYTTVSLSDAIYARQILGFYQKAEFLPLGVDRESVAYDKFLLSEAMCRRTNRTFCVSRAPLESRFESILFIAQRKIADILGPVPSSDVLRFAFGPGANTNVDGQRANPRVKLGVDLTCSSNFAPVAGDLLAEVPIWTALHARHESEDSYRVELAVSPGKLMFVPKNASSYRSIVVEPLLNGFFQKGVGDYIKRQLLHSGLNLYDQCRNQELALRGSVDDSLSTIDLSMASDCLSRSLVASLLPPDWYLFLDALRTPEICYKGVRHYLEKFSSMGNAYTFELESLIFWALSLSVCEFLHTSTQDVSVYGDDIIVPVAIFDPLVEVLAVCGFSVNQEKSYRSGPFRESCGSDYLKGFAIRPFYQKTLISDQSLYTMHNWFLRSGEYQLAAAAESATQPQYRLYGPDGYGDGHLIGSHSLTYPRHAVRAGWCGGYFDTYTLRPNSFKGLSRGDYALPSYSVYVRSGEHDPTDPDVVRGSRGYAKIAIYTLSTSVFCRRVL